MYTHTQNAHNNHHWLSHNWTRSLFVVVVFFYFLPIFFGHKICIFFFFASNWTHLLYVCVRILCGWLSAICFSDSIWITPCFIRSSLSNIKFYNTKLFLISNWMRWKSFWFGILDECTIEIIRLDYCFH